MTDTLVINVIIIVSVMFVWLWLCIFAAERTWRDEQDEHAIAPAEGWDAVRRIEKERRP